MALTITPHCKLAQDEAFLAWLTEHGAEPADVFLTEVGGDTTTVRRYRRRESDGGFHIDPATDKVAIMEPLVITGTPPFSAVDPEAV